MGVSRITAAAAAILSLASCSPLVLSASPLPDQLSQFLLYLLIWLLARSLVRGVDSPWRHSFSIALSLFFLALLRPANLLLGIAVLTIYFLFTRKDMARIALRAAYILIALATFWYPLKASVISWRAARADVSVSQAYGHLAGAMFFWNIYSSGSTFAGTPVITADTGRCSKQVFDAVEKHIADFPGASAAGVVRDHTLLNHYIIWQSMQSEYGPSGMDPIFWCAAFEGLHKQPRSVFYFIDGVFSFFLVSDVIYNNSTRQAWPSFQFYADG